jgi:uncharacterized membrane protein HdeD (DUF308 family)
MSASSPVPAERGINVVVGVINPVRVLVTRGVVAVAFGVLALVWPAVTVLALAVVFGIYALVDGVMRIIHTVRDRDQGHRWLTIVGGVLSIAAGIVSLIWPQITAVALALLVGVWAVVTGISEIAAAIRLRKQIRGESFLAFAGLISVIAGIVILFRPLAGALGIAIVIGIFAVIYGAFLIALGYRLHRENRAASPA